MREGLAGAPRRLLLPPVSRVVAVAVTVTVVVSVAAATAVASGVAVPRVVGVVVR